MDLNDEKFSFHINVSWLKAFLKLAVTVLIPYNIIMLSLGHFSVIPAPVACNLGMVGTFVITFAWSFIRKRRMAAKED